ncbi:hypothetical protein FJY94_04870 [Candidatus Kaiserbacteria bacterium]|nr:hypothetical protein [Candidatus Kaiserbacteria bacterium]
MLTFTDMILLASVIIALIALGAVIAVGNERVRQATLHLRDVAHEWALADIALKREGQRASFQFPDAAERLRALAQITLDVTGEAPDFVQVDLASGPVLALVARNRDGSEMVFTPSVQAFFNWSPSLRRRATACRAINGLVSEPFVIEKLEAAALSLGATALPRTEEWTLARLSAEDFSLLPRRGWLRRLRWS